MGIYLEEQEKMAVLYVVGIGPGKREMMTAEAEKALACCSVIAGYTVYVDLIKGWLGEKEYFWNFACMR